MKKLGPKYVIMNGSNGCTPDNYMYAENLDDAIKQIDQLFDGIPRGAKMLLRYNRIFHFPNPTEAGADYVEIAENTEITYADIERGF